MSKVTARRAQLFPWLNRVFPPSSPKITNPGEIDEIIKLSMPALPASLILERTAFEIFKSVNPATVVSTQPVPSGRFWWVHAADLFIDPVGVLGGTNAMFCFISVSDPNVVGADCMVAQGHFQPQDKALRISTHSHIFTLLQGGVPTLPNFPGGGGGTGGFLVPQGKVVKGLTTGPIGTAVMDLVVMFTECDSGELFPPVS